MDSSTFPNQDNNNTDDIIDDFDIGYKVYFTGVILYCLLFMLFGGLNFLIFSITKIKLVSFFALFIVPLSAFFSKKILANYYELDCEDISSTKLALLTCFGQLFMTILVMMAVTVIDNDSVNTFFEVVAFIVVFAVMYWKVGIPMLLAGFALDVFLLFIGYSLADNSSYSINEKISYLLVKFSVICFVFLLALASYQGLKSYQSYDTKHETISETRYQLNSKVADNPFYMAVQVLNRFHKGNSDSQAFASSQFNHSINYYIRHLPNPSNYPTIVIKSRHDKLSQAELQTLLKWVENGGHLITFKNSIHSTVRKNYWQEMETRLQELQKDHASIEEIKNDKIIQQYFSNTKHSGRSQLIRYLNLHSISHYDLSSEQADARKNQFHDYLDNLDSRLKKARYQDSGHNIINHDKAITSQKDYEIWTLARSYFRENQYLPETGFVTNQAGKTLMIKGEALTFIEPNLFYALNPQATPNNHYQQATANEIRQYFKDKQSIIQQRIAFLENNNITKGDFKSINWDGYYNVSFDDLKNLKAMNLAIDFIQKMNDKAVLSMFAPSLNNVLFDCNYGNGRISIINKDIPLNPNPDSGLLANLNNKNKGNLTNDSIHDIFTLYETFKQYDERSIYGFDNAQFVLELTKNDSQVWFLSDDNRKWTGAITEKIPFLADNTNRSSINNSQDIQSPIDFIYRTMSSDNYAKKVTRQKRQLKDEYDLP